MDEFVKSVVEHIIGTGEESKHYTSGQQGEETQPEHPSGIQNQEIYRPNYQRNKKMFYCVETQPEIEIKFNQKQYRETLEEDLRWLRLQAKEG